MAILGKNGPRVSRLGFGSMQMAAKKPYDDKESIATIQAAPDAGITYLDIADFYGMGRAEYLVGQAIKDRRDQAFLSVKCGAMFSPTGAFLGVDGRPKSKRLIAPYGNRNFSDIMKMKHNASSVFSKHIVVS